MSYVSSLGSSSPQSPAKNLALPFRSGLFNITLGIVQSERTSAF